VVGADGVDGTGGGGGGGSGPDPKIFSGGRGGAGVVIVSYSCTRRLAASSRSASVVVPPRMNRASFDKPGSSRPEDRGRWRSRI